MREPIIIIHFECKNISDKVYSCQWIPTANPEEWANYQRMQMNNFSDFPSFFKCPEDLS